MPLEQKAAHNHNNRQVITNPLSVWQNSECPSTTLTNQNCIFEESKGRLNSRNACCQSVSNVLSYSLLSKNIQIKIYRTVIYCTVLREEHRLMVFVNRCGGWYLGPEGRGNGGMKEIDWEPPWWANGVERGWYRWEERCIKRPIRTVLLNRRAAARYRALASIIPGRERFS